MTSFRIDLKHPLVTQCPLHPRSDLRQYVRITSLFDRVSVNTQHLHIFIRNGTETGLQDIIDIPFLVSRFLFDTLGHKESRLETLWTFWMVLIFFSAAVQWLSSKQQTEKKNQAQEIVYCRIDKRPKKDIEWGIGRKKNYPALFCCYLQTGPAQFGQNHPPSSFSPHQAIIATKQSWVIFFSADAPFPPLILFIPPKMFISTISA